MSSSHTTVEPFTSSQIVKGPNGVDMVMTVEGVVEVTRGPLGRFIDLADQITAEGLEVPPRIAALLLALQQPMEG